MKAVAAVMAFVAGEPVNVSLVCREAGVRPRCSASGLIVAGRRAGWPGSPATSTASIPFDVVGWKGYVYP